MTKGIRLHAAVWDGDLRQCPVWTAFSKQASSPESSHRQWTNYCPPVTHQSASPKWIKRVSKTRVRLAGIQLYVFCQEYRQQNQRINRAGAFEIRFVSEEGSLPFLVITNHLTIHIQRPSVSKSSSLLRSSTRAPPQSRHRLKSTTVFPLYDTNSALIISPVNTCTPPLFHYM